MAIFTAVRNKKQTAGTMMGVLHYVTQACKTMLDDQWMVTGHNCVARASYLEMMTTKQQFRKTDGRQFYHFVQSFPAEDGLTPQQVNAIGVEFAQRQFPDFEVVVATHLDTNHLHNHLVVNSVSFKDGKKLHQNAADLQRHRQVNDEICMASTDLLKLYAENLIYTIIVDKGRETPLSLDPPSLEKNYFKS